MAFTTDLLFVESSAAPLWSTDLFFLEASIDPAPATEGAASPWTEAWRNGIGTLSVTVNCTTGGNSVIPCVASSIVISQSESATQTITVNLIDDEFAFHPEGVGDYADVMIDGAECEFFVTWGGHERSFFATFKAAATNRDGGTSPTMSWPGTCEYDKLLKVKKTFQTLQPNTSAVAPTNKAVLAEMCTAAGVEGNWTRIKTTRIGTPFHRQQLTPGDVCAKMLDLTVDEIRTEGRTIEGYNPETAGRRWEYYPDSFDGVYSHSITPLNNDPIDKVIVTRAVAAGPLIPNSENNQAIRLSEFGEGNTVTFDPPVSNVFHRYNSRDFRAIASYFLYYSGETLIAARDVLNPLDYPDNIRRGRIWNCTSVSFTWGAANPTVDSDLTEADGEIVFYARQVPQATIGDGEDQNTPLDTVTRLPIGDGTNEIELPPNPLFYGEAEMEYFGEKYLRRVGRQQVEHSFTLPLNHLLRLGDTVAVAKDEALGGSGFIEIVVTSVTHTIAADPGQRSTQVTGVKYA